jgi:hypothetical protein
MQLVRPRRRGLTSFWLSERSLLWVRQPADRFSKQDEELTKDGCVNSLK